MAKKANSISIAKLSSTAHAAAKAALAKADLAGVEVEPGLIYNHPWIIGIIFNNPDLNQFGKYQQVAEHVTTELSRVEFNPQPDPPGKIASLYIYDHIIICGYRPVDEAPVTLE